MTLHIRCAILTSHMMSQTSKPYLYIDKCPFYISEKNEGLTIYHVMNTY